MRAKEVVVGRFYAAKVSGRVVVVKILESGIGGHFLAMNMTTGRDVYIKSPQRLRYEVPPPPAAQ